MPKNLKLHPIKSSQAVEAPKGKKHIVAFTVRGAYLDGYCHTCHKAAIVGGERAEHFLTLWATGHAARVEIVKSLPKQQPHQAAE